MVLLRAGMGRGQLRYKQVTFIWCLMSSLDFCSQCDCAEHINSASHPAHLVNTLPLFCECGDPLPLCYHHTLIKLCLISGTKPYVFFSVFLSSMCFWDSFMVLCISTVHSSYWLSSIPLYVCTTNGLSIHGHLGCFPFGAIMNKVALIYNKTPFDIPWEKTILKYLLYWSYWISIWEKTNLCL